MNNIRNNFLILSILFAGLFAGSILPEQNRSLFEVKITNRVIEPESIDEIQGLVKHAISSNKKICLVGAAKSQGGQTGSKSDAYRLSLERMNKILYLDLQNKEITVQAGIRWADIVKNISPFRLAIRAMQSFNDFSVCGSLGVNVHGQDVENAPLIKTVKSIKLVMPDGSVINASRDENYDIFKAAIGGYGLIGIIVEATLKLTDDALMKRKSVALDSSKLGDFISKLGACDNIHFFSARFSVGPSDFMQKSIGCDL